MVVLCSAPLATAKLGGKLARELNEAEAAVFRDLGGW
jgi:hypothetical protein